MEKMDISIEMLFDLIKENLENMGHYNTNTETLAISTNLKEEIKNTLILAVENFMVQIDSEIENDTSEQFIDDEDVFFLDDDDDDIDEDEDDEDDENDNNRYDDDK